MKRTNLNVLLDMADADPRPIREVVEEIIKKEGIELLDFQRDALQLIYEEDERLQRQREAL